MFEIYESDGGFKKIVYSQPLSGIVMGNDLC